MSSREPDGTGWHWTYVLSKSATKELIRAKTCELLAQAKSLVSLQCCEGQPTVLAAAVTWRLLGGR